MWHNSAMPSPNPIHLCYQVANVLRHRILDGVYRPGERIGTEKDLCEQFGVSRSTVAQALSELERESLVVRRRKLGTFVAEHLPLGASISFTGFLEDLLAQVLRLESRETRVEQVEAGEEVALALQLGADRRVVRIERLRLLEGKPLAHAVDYLPLDLGAGLTVADLMELSVVHFLERRLGVRLDEALQVIQAVAASGELADKLGIAQGDPMLQAQRTFYAAGRPVQYVVMHHRADRYQYTARLTRITRG